MHRSCTMGRSCLWVEWVSEWGVSEWVCALFESTTGCRPAPGPWWMPFLSKVDFKKRNLLSQAAVKGSR